MHKDERKTEKEEKNENMTQGSLQDGKIEALEKEREEYLKGWQRAKADFSNYKKEETRRFEEFLKFSNAAIVQELLHILDSFELGLATLHKESEAAKGMRLIKTQFEELLRKHGLEKISVIRGAPFDPSVHEAVGEIESDVPEGAVAEELSRGYRFHQKVLRPARVMISKGQSKK